MRTKTLLLIFLILSTFQIGKAYLPEYLLPGEHFEYKPYYHQHNSNLLQQIPSALEARPYDVLEYDIFLDWYRILLIDNPTGDNRKFNGINKIKIKIDTAVLSKIELDAVQILIDSIIYSKDNNKIQFTQNQDIVNITLPSQFFKGDTLQFVIYYTYIGKENKGMYIYEKGRYVGQGPPPKRDSVFVLERLAYTFGEPQLARYWIPCNDAPHDKAMIKMAVKVPKGYNIATNGLRKNIKTISDSTFYYYESMFPMTTYLITVNASKFYFEEDQYIRINNPNDTVPVHYYVWEQDWTSDTTDGTAYNAKYAFRKVVEMMEAYSKVYGEYPFEKYGMVAVQPFEFGGMEHQTMTTINRSWLRGYSEGGIAHELAHQWIGDLVTCATWFDIWINEGGATWSEAIWFEQTQGRDFYYYYMNQVIGRYFANEALYNIPIYGVPINSIFAYPISILEYNKASWVYHMLRENLGDTTFFGALRYLFEKYKYQSIETKDFMNTFKEYVANPSLNFDKFFEQWIMKAGHPIFEISSTSAIGSDYFDIEVNINQIQEGTNIPSVFEMPIELLLYKDSSVQQKQIVYMDKRSQSFEFRTDFRPDSIKINTNKILGKVLSNTLSVQNTEKINTKDTYPNPIKTGNNFNLTLNLTQNGTLNIDIFDILGNRIKNLHNKYLQKGNYTIELSTFGLSPGFYLIKYENEHDLGWKKIIITE